MRIRTVELIAKGTKVVDAFFEQPTAADWATKRLFAPKPWVTARSVGSSLTSRHYSFRTASRSPVVPQADELRMPQVPVGRPLNVFELTHQLGFQPHTPPIFLAVIRRDLRSVCLLSPFLVMHCSGRRIHATLDRCE
jgi:hypothetical protein